MTICAISLLHAGGDVEIARKVARSSSITRRQWNKFYVLYIHGLNKEQAFQKIRDEFPNAMLVYEAGLSIADV